VPCPPLANRVALINPWPQTSPGAAIESICHRSSNKRENSEKKEKTG